MSEKLESCNCLRNIEKKVQLKTNGNYVSVLRPNRFEVGYKPTRKDGTIAKVWRYEAAYFDYCPLCGVKKVAKK